MLRHLPLEMILLSFIMGDPLDKSGEIKVISPHIVLLLTVKFFEACINRFFSNRQPEISISLLANRDIDLLSLPCPSRMADDP